LRIGVLRGGPSSEYDISLQSGERILSHLRETHKPLDIFISKDGVWHIQGMERPPERILNQVDVIWNALHGAYGEGGGVQEILESHAVPYTGSGRFSSAITMNKATTKNGIKHLGIKTPVSVVIRQTDPFQAKIQEVFNSIPQPLVAKPTLGGSSFGLHIVKSFPDLSSVIEEILSGYDSALVEEYISGKPVSCFVVDNFRGQSTYVFPAVAEQSSISAKERHEVESMAKQIHEWFGLSHYSKSDFIISPRRGVYFLEVNTTPKLEKKSLLHRALETVGVDTVHFIHHLLSLAVNRK